MPSRGATCCGQDRRGSFSGTYGWCSVLVFLCISVCLSRMIDIVLRNIYTMYLSKVLLVVITPMR